MYLFLVIRNLVAVPVTVLRNDLCVEWHIKLYSHSLNFIASGCHIKYMCRM